MRRATRRRLWHLFGRHCVSALAAFGAYQALGLKLSEFLSRWGLVDFVAITLPMRRTHDSLGGTILLDYCVPVGGLAAFSAIFVQLTQIAATVLVLPICYRRAWCQPAVWIRCDHEMTRPPFMFAVGLAMLCVYLGGYMGAIGVAMLAASTAVGVAVFIRRHIFARAVHIVPLCGACGYILRGIASGRCPECGAPIRGKQDMQAT